MIGARVLVTGGRNYGKRSEVFRRLDALHAEHPIAAVIQGACPTGADKYARIWAVTNHIELLSYPAKWEDIDAPGAKIRVNARREPYNILAGFQRNGRMLEESSPTHVMAFPGNNGTADMVEKTQRAIRRGTKIILLDYRAPLRSQESSVTI